MVEVPHDWQAYARLQQQLAKSNTVDSWTWGLEAGLDYLLQPSIEPTKVDAVVSSAARKHRHRVASLRRVHADISHAILQDSRAGEENPTLRVIEIQQMGTVIADHVREGDWRVLTALTAGEDYAVIAGREHTSSGALRVRVSRLRAKLALLAA